MSQTPMQRYEWATGPDGWLTANGWERLARDLEGSADFHRSECGASCEVGIKMADRAADCRDRAAAIRACALDTLRDISRPL